MERKGKGIRLNEGKPRYDLVPQHAQKEYVNVLTFGSTKYAERNWEQGMSWSKVIASLKRHVAKIEQGEDYDEETGLLHSAHVMCNAGFLTEYYKTYPQGDDRPHNYLSRSKVGLDVDEVLADWVGHWCKYFDLDIPTAWNFDRDIGAKFKELKNNELFWMTLPRKIDPKDIPFEPHCYITSRSVPQEWTEQWLDKMGFPTAPVYTVGLGESKIDIAKKSGIDIFVDDRFENFVELNNAGICCYLFDAPHNQRYDVGHKRIYSLKELG